jgi:2-oxo-4-hydroxy-4-carboxy-5-ureidoimidazoline decarboxylase
MRVPDVAELNDLPAADAAAALAVLFESAPRFVTRLVAARPFADAGDLFERARSIATSLPENEAIELVSAHPRLGAPRDSVSALSAREQGYDRPTADGDDLGGRLARLNDAYEERFGFRYCVFVAGRSRAELIPELEQRVASGDREAELRRAVTDAVAIARDRYERLAPARDAHPASGGGERVDGARVDPHRGNGAASPPQARAASRR